MVESTDFYGDGTFDFIPPEDFVAYYRNAHWAITQTKMWDWLYSFTPDEKKGFMFCSHPNLKIIEQKMYEQDIAHGHSGASFGFILREMEYIAKYGYDAFRQVYIKKHNAEKNYEN